MQSSWTLIAQEESSIKGFIMCNKLLHFDHCGNAFSFHSTHSHRVMHVTLKYAPAYCSIHKYDTVFWVYFSYLCMLKHPQMAMAYRVCCSKLGHTWVWHVYDPLRMGGMRWECVWCKMGTDIIIFSTHSGIPAAGAPMVHPSPMRSRRKP